MNTNEQLKTLSISLITAKEAEDKCKTERIDIEEKISALIPGPERGSKTVTLDDGTKITVERGFNYKADCPKINDLGMGGWMDGYIPPIKTKTTRELDVAGYEWYRDNDSEIFNELSKCVTVTPKKTAVSIKTK